MHPTVYNDYVLAGRTLLATAPTSMVTYCPPVTSIVTPVTKSASVEARKQITRAMVFRLGHAPQGRSGNHRLLLGVGHVLPAGMDAFAQRSCWEQ